MSLEVVTKIVESILGVDPYDTDQRQPIIDILMDYLNNPREEQYIVESLKSFVPEKMSFLQLSALVGDVQALKEGTYSDEVDVD